MSIGPFKDFDACLVGLKDKYPSEATRRKVCGAMKSRLESTKPLIEGVAVSGTTLPGGTDGHVHDFTLETYVDQESGDTEVRMWTSPPYVPGSTAQSLALGDPGSLPVRVTHWHDWATTQRTSEAMGHDHELPALPPLAEEDLATLQEAEQVVAGAVVEDGPGYWLVRNVTATREGVSLGRRVLKRATAVRETADLMDGAPVVYGVDRHLAGDFEPDPLAAPGFAVNARLEGGAAVYDAVLWAANPPGHSVPSEDIAYNRAFVEAVRQGQAIHNSIGTIGVERMATGKAPPMGGGSPVSYESEQVHVVKVGHVAILSPVAAGRGSCPAPACGAVPQEAKALAEALGVRRDAVLIAAGMAVRRAK